MRRRESPDQGLPDPIRRRTLGPCEGGFGSGDDEPSQLGGASWSSDEHGLRGELSARGADHTQEAAQDQGEGGGITGGGALPAGPRRADHGGAADPAGEGQDCQGSGTGRQVEGKEGGDQIPHRPARRLSDPFPQLQRGGRHQHGGMLQEPDGDLSVEEAFVATPGEGCGGEDHGRSSLEEESSLAGHAAGQGSGFLVGPFRSSEATAACPGGASSDVSSDVIVEEIPTAEDEGIHQEGDDYQDYEGVGRDVRESIYALEELYQDHEELGSLYDEDKEVFYQKRQEPTQWTMRRPARGLTQHMKMGVQKGLRMLDRLKRGSQVAEKFMVLEIFSGSSMLTQVAADSPGWGAYQPVDVILSEDGDMKVKANREKVKEMVRNLKPDLVVITPPCGPWCAWQRLRQDWDELDDIRREQMPFWRMTKEVWDIQNEEGRLCLTEQLEGSEALETRPMVERDPLYRVVVDQCQFGLKDPVSHRLYRKTTALDVNDQAFAMGLATVTRCRHRPAEHEQVRGSVRVDGRLERRSTLAGRWTKQFAKYILEAAQVCLAGRPGYTRRDPVPASYDALPVALEEGVLTPEEVLRRQMKQMGAEGERYDYILFESEARMLPRRTRATLAHLHVALGHLSNERLHRMISLAGGNSDLLNGVKNMRCQVCQMVKPPGSKPQASYLKPTNFNQRVSGDVFFIWDIKEVKYAVIHYIDELTDYHVGALDFDPSSDWAADVLCRLWYDVFGPPDVLITDGGTEFQGALARMNELFAVQHEVVPDQAKWRLGHAERHGSIMKIMLMKVVTELQIDNLKDMQCALASCFASKNRVVGKHGVAPLQAVTGRNTPLPGSLMAQLTSGKVKFKLNEAITQEEAIRRADRIRAASIEACHWIDAHEGLRRALAARSRPPHLELLREGTAVYVYDPPANRRGLARRLQDNVSWSGPAIVVCVEREGTTPKKVVRLRSRVKAYPLEKIRLATADEMVSADFIVGALKDLGGELNDGRLQVEDLKKDDPKEEEAAAEPPAVSVEAEVEKKRELLHDVPQALGKDERDEPHLLPFKKKQKLFEQLAKDLGAPSAMQEAAVRDRLENAYGQLKKVRKDWKKEHKEKERRAARGSTAASSARGTSAPPARGALVVEVEQRSRGAPFGQKWRLSKICGRRMLRRTTTSRM